MDMQANEIVAAPEGFALQRVPARICVVCKTAKAATAEFFAIVGYGTFKNNVQLDDTCQLCRGLLAQQRDLKFKPGVISRLMDEMSLRRNVPQSHDLLRELYGHFGGAPGLASEVKMVYDSLIGKNDFKTAAKVLGQVIGLQVSSDKLQQGQVIEELNDLDKLREYAALLESNLAAKLVAMQESENGTFTPEAQDA